MGTTDYVPEKRHATLTPASSLRIARGFQRMSIAQLAKASGIDPDVISAIEAGTLTLGRTRAERLARALRIHPRVLLFPHGPHDKGPRA